MGLSSPYCAPPGSSGTKPGFLIRREKSSDFSLPSAADQPFSEGDLLREKSAYGYPPPSPPSCPRMVELLNNQRRNLIEMLTRELSVSQRGELDGKYIFGRHRDTFMFIFSAMTVHTYAWCGAYERHALYCVLFRSSGII